MKRMIIILSILTALSLSGMAQDQSYIYRTHGILNGRAWLEWSHDVKLGYVTGYENHWQATYEVIDHRLDKPSEFGYEVFAMPFALSFPEIVHGLDVFYGEPTNGPINIRYALRILAAKAHGVSLDVIQKLTEQARKDAIKQSK